MFSPSFVTFRHTVFPVTMKNGNINNCGYLFIYLFILLLQKIATTIHKSLKNKAFMESDIFHH